MDFFQSYSGDPWSSIAPSTRSAFDPFRSITTIPQAYFEFESSLKHCSFNHGLVRFLTTTTSPSLTEWNSPSGWASDWKSGQDRLIVIGFDWLGRQIAFDRKLVRDGQMLIDLLEPGTELLLETDLSFFEMISSEIINNSDALLASASHAAWLQAGNPEPKINECVGYRVPLFFGGKDEIENLELSDMDVYLSICGQLASGLR
jgi:hypothetical protein